MHLSRKDKERIAIIVTVVIVAPLLFFGLRPLLTSSPPPPEQAPAAAPEEPGEPPLPDPPMVTFLDGSADGRVDIEEGWKGLATGDELAPGSIVRTYPASALDLRLQSGSVLRIMEETLFSLADLSTETIEMDIREGELISRLERIAGEQEFNIRTPGAVAGVRGTELSLRVDGEETTVYGISGSVEVSNPEFPEEVTLLTVHQKTSVSVGSPPTEAAPMTEAEINRYRQLLNALNQEQVLIVTDRITFRPNSAELTPDARDALTEIYEELRGVEEQLEIVGHTADIGSEESQLTLSTERAEAVKEYLVELGLPANRLYAVGMGGTRPVATGDDPSSLRRNRRVEFRLREE